MKDDLATAHPTWNDKQINSTVTLTLSKEWIPFEFTTQNPQERNTQLLKYWQGKIKMGGNWLSYLKRFGMGAAILWPIPSKYAALSISRYQNLPKAAAKWFLDIIALLIPHFTAVSLLFTPIVMDIIKRGTFTAGSLAALNNHFNGDILDLELSGQFLDIDGGDDLDSESSGDEMEE